MIEKMNEDEVKSLSTPEAASRLFKLVGSSEELQNTISVLETELRLTRQAEAVLIAELKTRDEFIGFLDRFFDQPKKAVEPTPAQPEPEPETKPESNPEPPASPTDPNSIDIPTDLYAKPTGRKRICQLLKANPQRTFRSDDITHLCTTTSRSLNDFVRSDAQKDPSERQIERRGEHYFAGAALGGRVPAEAEALRESDPEPKPEPPTQPEKEAAPEGEEEVQKKTTAAERKGLVLNFLEKNPESTFTAKDLAEKAGATPADVYALFQVDRRKKASERRVTKRGMKYAAGDIYTRPEDPQEQDPSGPRDPSRSVPGWERLESPARIRAVLQYNPNTSFEPEELADLAGVKPDEIDSILHAERNTTWNKKTVQKINGLFRAGNVLVASPRQPSNREPM